MKVYIRLDVKVRTDVVRKGYGGWRSGVEGCRRVDVKVPIKWYGSDMGVGG